MMACLAHPGGSSALLRLTRHHREETQSQAPWPRLPVAKATVVPHHVRAVLWSCYNPLIASKLAQG